MAPPASSAVSQPSIDEATESVLRTRPIEDLVIDAVADFLRGDGWQDIKTRSAANREHGADIEARLGERHLLVEAKGWPAPTYVQGVKAGQPRTYLPYTQGRAYFSNALLPALLNWSEHHAEVALAFPRQGTYERLVNRSARALRHLGIGVYYVTLGMPVAVERHLDHRSSSDR
jgi:hypothetical protein